MDPNRARELLADRRAQIERELADAGRREDDADPDPLEASDASADLTDTEVSEALAEQLRDQLDAIERAERRIAEGTYGLSIESGEPIPDGRLESIPWAERTAEEQARFDG
jgi:DnaK suppressor protein